MVVINHHLLFADLDVRDSGVAQLLPSAGVVVVDEAHQLNDTGVQFAGEALSSQQLIGYARDALRITQEHARGMADWPVLCATLEQAVRELRLQAGRCRLADDCPGRPLPLKVWMPLSGARPW